MCEWCWHTTFGVEYGFWVGRIVVGCLYVVMLFEKMSWSVLTSFVLQQRSAGWLELTILRWETMIIDM